MKYVIDIPDDGQCQYKYNEDTKELKFPCPRIDPNSFMGLDIVLTGATPYTEPNEDEIRQKVENEVWDFAREMISTSGHEVSEMWGCVTNFGEVMHNTTYQEAKAKYEVWKKSKEEIRVGDEIKIKTSYSADAVVIGMDDYDLFIIWKDGETDRIEPPERKQWVKTGRHFKEVEELLKKITEESNED